MLQQREASPLKGVYCAVGTRWNKHCVTRKWFHLLKADPLKTSPSASRRSRDPPNQRGFFCSPCLQANAEMVPPMSSCYCVLLLLPSRLNFITIKRLASQPMKLIFQIMHFSSYQKSQLRCHSLQAASFTILTSSSSFSLSWSSYLKDVRTKPESLPKKMMVCLSLSLHKLKCLSFLPCFPFHLLFYYIKRISPPPPAISRRNFEGLTQQCKLIRFRAALYL